MGKARDIAAGAFRRTAHSFFSGADLLHRDLIRETAFPMLFVRVAEGLAVLITFYEFYRPDDVQRLVVYAAIASYMVGNAFVALRYRANDIRMRWVWFDLAINLVPITVVIQASGGIDSPLVLMYPLKIAGYLVVFGPAIGMVCMLGSIAGLAFIAGADIMKFWPPAPTYGLKSERRLSIGTRLGFVLLLLIGGVPLTRRLRRQGQLLIEESEKVRIAAERERFAAERERYAGNIAGVLLHVTDSVSRATQPEEVFANVSEKVPQVLNIDYCGVIEWDRHHGVYRFRAISGLDDASAETLRALRLAPKDAPDLEWVRQLGECAIVPPLSGTPLQDVPALLIAPLQSGGKFFGVLLFARRNGASSFRQEDVAVAEGVAAQVAVALERADLIETARRFVQALDSTGESVVITDSSAHIVYVNPAFVRTFGYAEEDLKGTDAVGIVRNLPPQWIADVATAARRGGWRGEAVVTRRDGVPVPIMLDVSVIRDTMENVQGSVAILEDISERKRMQERMQRADRLAAAGEMAAGIAHEVNNALVAILHDSEAADTSASAEDLRRSLQRVNLQGTRIAGIVQGLLGFARPHPPERQSTSVRELVDETLSLHSYELDKAGVRFEVDVPDDIPPLWVDRKQIQQVLVNLIANAQQALSPRDGGHLWIQARRDGGDVVLSVTDDGPGIPVEDLPRIFDPFFTTKEEGTGLGLSVSYQILRAHEGDLSVASTLGEGTSFTLRLPAAVPAQNERALVVDDDPIVGQTLVEMLAQQGLEAEHVLSGSEALELMRSGSRYDVIFLDVRLPDVSGPEIYAHLAEHRPDQARRVIFVTGGLWRSKGSSRENLPHRLALPKPCTAQQVRQVLQSLRQQLAAAA